MDVDTYVDTCIDTQDTRVKIVCEREGHTTWFEEILFISIISRFFQFIQ